MSEVDELTIGRRLLRVRRSGRGRPVVLVHGWLGDSADNNALAAELSADHDVVNVDLRGHGGSTGPAGGFGLSDFADDVAETITALALTRPLVAGHSMGGAVALTLAARSAARSAGLGGVIAVDSPWAIVAPDAATVARVPALWGDGFAERRDRLTATRAALLPGVAIRTPAQAVAAESFASLMAWDGPAAVTAATVPVHMIFADGSWPAVSAKLAGYPSVRALHIAGTGHWVQVEQPAQVAAFIRSAPVAS